MVLFRTLDRCARSDLVKRQYSTFEHPELCSRAPVQVGLIFCASAGRRPIRENRVRNLSCGIGPSGHLDGRQRKARLEQSAGRGAGWELTDSGNQALDQGQISLGVAARIVVPRDVLPRGPSHRTALLVRKAEE